MAAKQRKGAQSKRHSESTELTAPQFVEELMSMRSAAELKKIQRYFKSGEGEYGEGDELIGVRMGHVFSLAKQFQEMPPAEIEKLLESPIHEVRTGAVSIMDFQARNPKTTAKRKNEPRLAKRRPGLNADRCVAASFEVHLDRRDTFISKE